MRPRTLGLATALWALSMLSWAANPSAAGDPRLADAAQRQDKETVRALLKQHVDVNAPQADGATALAWTAHWDDLDTADLLIRAGADVSAANDLGVTPLMLASTNGNAAMVEKLLRAGAKPDAARSTGDTALMMAARAGSAPTVKLLVANGAQVNAKTARAQTALMWAAAERHPEVARVLIEAGADVRARTAVKTPPNKNYAGRQDSDVAKGPRPLLKENEAMNPEYRRDLWRAREAPRSEGGFTPLLYAVLSGDVETVRVVLAGGAGVNDPAADGMTALVLALVKHHEPLALFLLDQGADPSAAGTGYTALHVASMTGQIEAVKALLARGANVNARLETPVTFTEAFVTGTKVSPGAGWVDIKGATPFMTAARAVNASIMRVLADAGANPRLTSEDGTTAVMLAAGLGKRANADIGYYTWDEVRAIEAIKLALDLGVDINASNQDGETALHAAAYHAANELIQFLVERRAKLNATNWQRQTPLRIAEGHLVCCTTFVRHAETAELLRKLGADPAVGVQLNFGLAGYVDDKLKSSKQHD